MRVLSEYEMSLIAGGDAGDPPPEYEDNGDTGGGWNWWEGAFEPDGYAPDGTPQIVVPGTRDPEPYEPAPWEGLHTDQNLPPEDWSMTPFDWSSSVASGQASGMLALSDDFLAHKTVINLPPYVFGGFSIVMTAREAYQGDVQGTYEAAASTLGGMLGSWAAVPAMNLAVTALELAGATIVFGPGAVFVGVATAAALGTMAGYMLANNIKMDDIFETLYKMTNPASSSPPSTGGGYGGGGYYDDPYAYQNR